MHLQDFLLFLPVLLFSVIAHEYAHGYAALKQGDTTALAPGVDAVAAVPDGGAALGEDRWREPNKRAANQRSGPAVERGLFLVPKVSG